MPRFEKQLLLDAKPTGSAKIGSLYFDAFKLGDVADVNQLVTRHELKKLGIDPHEIPLIPTNVRTNTLAMAIYKPNVRKSGIFYNPAAVENWDSEDFLVLLAHETAHMTQPLESLKTSEAAVKGGFHKDDHGELDAQVWEARQATKFQWDDDRYKLFVDRVYGAVIRNTFGPDFDIMDAEQIERLGLTERRFIQVIREEAEERPASFATMRRRPGVRVRRHVRRRR